MKFDQLQYFMVVAETQHIGRAAKILNISPSAISHSLKNLEDSLGHALFEKSGKNIFLTDYGRRFSGRVRGLVSEVDRLKNEFRSSELPLDGTVRVGASHGLCDRFMAPHLAALHKRHPALVFEVYSLRSSQVIEKTVAGEIDVGACFSPQPHPAITIQHKIPMALKIVMRKDHPLIKTKNRRNMAEQLSEYSASAPKAFSGIDICEDHPALRKIGVRSQVRFMFDSYQVVAEYLKKSDSWCLMPVPVMEDFGLAALEVPDFKADINVSLITPKGRSLPPSILDELKTFF